MKNYQNFTIIISENQYFLTNRNSKSNRIFDMKTVLKITSIFLLLLLFGCSGSKKRDNFIIGISSDIESFNPAFTMTMTEGNVSELIYLGLVGYNWNEAKGDLEPFPLLAESWTWGKDSSYVDIKINKDAKWSDGTDLTAQDVLFTFDFYSDPAVQSKFYGTFENFILKKDQSIDLEKTFRIVSDKEIIINFAKGGKPSTFSFDLPLLPKHIFEKVNRKEAVNSDLNLKPVGSGPYVLDEWNKNQYIKLKLNKNSFLTGNGSIGELVFKVVPDYNNLIVQLKKGEIDFAEELKFEDVKSLKENSDLVITTIKGRDYDYMGLNNIDPDAYAKGEIKSNPLFGDSLVRKAVIHAIDREMIVNEYLGGYGKTAVVPIAPIFKSIADTLLKPYSYSLKTAKELLSRAGWNDTDSDGYVDKNGKNFSFTLAVPGGNKLRSEIATIIKDNLKQAGIQVSIEPVEPSVFVEKMFARKFNAFLSGWSVPIPIDLKPYWYSDLKNNPANTVGFRNKKTDQLLDEMKKRLPPAAEKKVYYDFQRIMYDDAPAVFLFWKDKIAAYNSRLRETGFSPLGTVHYCWKWRLAN